MTIPRRHHWGPVSSGGKPAPPPGHPLNPLYRPRPQIKPKQHQQQRPFVRNPVNTSQKFQQPSQRPMRKNIQEEYALEESRPREGSGVPGYIIGFIFGALIGGILSPIGLLMGLIITGPIGAWIGKKI